MDDQSKELMRELIAEVRTLTAAVIWAEMMGVASTPEQAELNTGSVYRALRNKLF